MARHDGPPPRGSSLGARLLIAATIATAACGGPAGEAPGEGKGGEAPADPIEVTDPIEVRDASARILATSGAVYLTLVDRSGEGDRLLAASTPVARAAEPHETVMDGDVMRMLPRPEGFAVPPGGELAMTPGGKHLMLVEPELPEGATELPLVLEMERAGRVEIMVPVAGAGEDEGHAH